MQRTAIKTDNEIINNESNLPERIKELSDYLYLDSRRYDTGINLRGEI